MLWEAPWKRGMENACGQFTRLRPLDDMSVLPWGGVRNVLPGAAFEDCKLLAIKSSRCSVPWNSVPITLSQHLKHLKFEGSHCGCTVMDLRSVIC